MEAAAEDAAAGQPVRRKISWKGGRRCDMETVAEDAPPELDVEVASPRGGAATDGVRDAVRVELAELFGGRQQFRELVRWEVLGALEDYHERAAEETRRASNQTNGRASQQGWTDAPSLASSGGRSYPHYDSTDAQAEQVSVVDPTASLSPKIVTASRQAAHEAQQEATVAGDVTGRESRFRMRGAPTWTRRTSQETEKSLGSVDHVTAACKHFSDVAMGSNASSCSDECDEDVVHNRASFTHSITSRVTLYLGEEPEVKGNGPLGRLVTSHAFESVMRLVILLNCAFMVYLANAEITDWNVPAGPSQVTIFAGEACFLTVYLCEMLLKLAAFRLSYFRVQSNSFDCLLVCIDVWDMTTKLVETSIFNASYLRMFRLLKLGKALRAMQVIRAFDKLQAFLICIHGSLSSLVWSLVMLNIILYMFSLCIVQIVAMHFREQGEQLGPEGRAAFEVMYGSVQASMLTLFQLTTDGSNWREPYELVSQTGWVGSFIFLLYVSFTHIAVINIITGVFVESAMQNLAPDRDSMALDHQFKEQQAARELEELFRSVDKDGRGTVSKDDFDALVRAGRLPRLLSLLGLREQHARHFFKLLASASPFGEVSYSSFVRGCMKLKGAATSFDLHMLQVDMHTVQQTLRDLRRRPKQMMSSRSSSK